MLKKYGKIELECIVCPVCKRVTKVYAVTVTELPVSRILPYELGGCLVEAEPEFNEQIDYYICETCWSELSNRDILRGIRAAIRRFGGEGK